MHILGITGWQIDMGSYFLIARGQNAGDWCLSWLEMQNSSGLALIVVPIMGIKRGSHCSCAASQSPSTGILIYSHHKPYKILQPQSPA